MFALFGGGYSGGGSTWEHKEADYNDRVQAAENHGAAIPGASANPFSS